MKLGLVSVASTLTQYVTETLHQVCCYVFNFEMFMLDQKRSLGPTIYSNPVLKWC